jgi:transposase
MPAPRFVRPLDAAELAALQERYRTTNDADERSRCQMLLFSARGKSVPEIADLILFDDDTVLYWLNRYEAEGLAGLATKPRSGRPPKSRYAL